MSITGTGTTFAFATQADGWAGKVMDISHDGYELPAIENTHMGTTGGRSYYQGSLPEGGELQITCEFDPETDFPDLDYSKQGGAAIDTFTLTYPVQTSGNTAASLTGSGMITSVRHGLVTEEKPTIEITVKITGAVTFTAETT